MHGRGRIAPVFKIAFIGCAGSGKTCIIKRFHEDTFSTHIAPTLGSSVVTHDVMTINGSISLNIWDTADQEHYRNLVPMFCRSAAALSRKSGTRFSQIPIQVQHNFFSLLQIKSI
jgi:small GTP-binding protein